MLTQEIAIVARVLIAFIFDPAQLMLLRVGFKLLARLPEQRTQQHAAVALMPHRHRRQPGRSAAALQRQQQRLALVVEMLRGQQPLIRLHRRRQRLIARRARRALHALLARVDLHAQHLAA